MVRGTLGCAVIGAAYLGILQAAGWWLGVGSFRLDGAAGQELGGPLAWIQVTVPYAVGGVYAALTGRGLPRGYPFLLGVAAALAERAILLGLGYGFSAAGVEGVRGAHPLDLIRSEAAPYFTPAYAVAGLVGSPLCTARVARWRSPRCRAAA